MNNQKIALASLAMDLKRVALALHRGSLSMANRFRKEALERSHELSVYSTQPYINKLLARLQKSLEGNDNEKIAEDALMYSTLFQNCSYPFSPFRDGP